MSSTNTEVLRHANFVTKSQSVSKIFLRILHCVKSKNQKWIFPQSCLDWLEKRKFANQNQAKMGRALSLEI